VCNSYARFVGCTIRQLVAEGLRAKMQETVLEQYRKSRITLRQGAEMLGITYLEMNQLLRDNHIPLAREASVARRRKPSKARR